MGWCLWQQTLFILSTKSNEPIYSFIFCTQICNIVLSCEEVALFGDTISLVLYLYMYLKLAYIDDAHTFG